MSFTLSVVFYQVTCKCGGVYAITEDYRSRCHKLAEYWNCPYCKTEWGYTVNSEAENLRAELVETKSELERCRLSRRDADTRVATAYRRIYACRGVITKLKKKV